MADQEEDNGWMASAWSMGAAAWNYAADTVNSFMGYEDLNVIDPTSGEAKAAETDLSDKRQKAFTGYKEYLGKDITSLVILPVWIMQPFTMLQNMAEIMEYSAALDKAATCEDPYMRMAWVVGFTMGPFAAIERPWKPFNPILGETFEYYQPERGVKYLAEQVSHHPPVGVSHGENDLWTYDLVSAVKTKFLGNSVEVYPIGRTRIKLKGTDEVFSLVPPPTKAHNLIVGSIWIDTFGDYTLLNATTGAKAHLFFQPCGWFGSGRYEVSGTIKNAEGVPMIALSGKWNSHMDAVECDEHGDPKEGAETVRVWTCREKPDDDPYNFTHFAHELNSCEGVNPMPSDSRRRPDRALLELGKSSESAVAKHHLEEMQRAERRKREEDNKGMWKPRWFTALGENAKVLPGEFGNEECPQWEFNAEFLALEPKAACNPEEVQGKGFSPWEYPDIHPKLGKESER